jgi:DNA-binding transcriptional LysR family regulator
MGIPLELKQLRHVIAVAEAGTFARAADVVGITQPALSESIANLERELGVKLFERGRFGAVVTESGSALIKRGRLIQSELRLAALELDGLKGGLRGQVTIGVGPFFEPAIIPRTIAAFNRKRPKANIMTVEGTSVELFERLACGDLDFVVSTPLDGIKANHELVQEILFQTTDALIVRKEHPLAVRGGPGMSISPEDLASYPWIVSARVDAVRHHTLTMLAAAGIDRVPTVVRTDSVPIIRYLLTMGDYIAVLSSTLAPLNVELGSLVPLTIAGLDLPRHGALTYRRRSKLSPLAQLFVTEFKAICAEMIGTHPA